LDEIISQQVPFPCHLYLFPGKLLFREITLILYFPAIFSCEFTLSLYYPVNDRQLAERKIFSTEVYPQPSDPMSTLSIDL
jgi:hypothetical protein